MTAQLAAVRDDLVAERQRLNGRQAPAPADPWRGVFTDGRVAPCGDWIFDEPIEVPAIWGTGSDVLWAQGESLVVVAPEGVGKTTVAGQLVLARINERPAELLGLPVEPATRPVLYIAADRPRQAARSFGRMVRAGDRELLNDRLLRWRGPLPFDAAQEPERLAEMAQTLGVGTVVIDSVKDIALDLSKDETGSRLNLCFQHVTAAGIELVALHHDRKPAGDAQSKPRTAADVYGSRWLTAGAGSVIYLAGEAGDTLVTLLHLKPVAEKVGPLKLVHNHQAGVTTLHEGANLDDLLRASTGGLAVRDAAIAVYETAAPKSNQVEATRRQLDRLVTAGRATKTTPATPRETVFYRGAP